jgi:hypothetical protein
MNSHTGTQIAVKVDLHTHIPTFTHLHILIVESRTYIYSHGQGDVLIISQLLTSSPYSVVLRRLYTTMSELESRIRMSERSLQFIQIFPYLFKNNVGFQLYIYFRDLEQS